MYYLRHIDYRTVAYCSSICCWGIQGISQFQLEPPYVGSMTVRRWAGLQYGVKGGAHFFVIVPHRPDST